MNQALGGSMRKLWPPTYDDFSVRVWAAVISILVNALLWIFVSAGSFVAFLFLAFPGIFPAVILGSGIEDRFNWIGAGAWILTELAFYYFIAWWLIGAFRPATNWWPEKKA